MRWPLGLIIPVQDPTPFSAFTPAEWPESLAQVRAAGYPVVELALTDPSPLSINELAEMLEKTGLKLAALTTGQAFWKEGLALSSPDEKVRTRAVERLKAHIALARSFQAVVIVGLLRGKDGKQAVLRKALAECLAEEKNVRLALEPLNRYETSLLNTVSEVSKFLDELGQGNVGIIFDAFHANIEEVSLAEAIRLAGDRLFHVHLADSNRWIPGFGHLDFSGVWQALEEINYEGSLVLECLPRPSPQYLFSAKEVARRVGLRTC